MTAGVSVAAPTLSAANVRSGVAISSREWQAAARLSNWLIGRGSTVLPGHVFGAISAGSSTRSVPWAYFARAPIYHRVWYVNARATTGTPFTFSLQDGANPAESFTVTNERGDTVLKYVVPVSSPGNTFTTGTLTIATPSLSGAGFFDSITCVEAPRADITYETGQLDVERFAAGKDIRAGYSGLTTGIERAAALARRSGLFYWAVPSSSAWSTTSTSYSNIFLLQPPALGRQHYPDDTLKAAYVKVYARATTQQGSFRVQTTSGDTVTRTITVSTFQWYPTGSTVDVLNIDCDNLTTSDGRRSNRYDELTFSGRTNTAGGTLEIAGIIVYERD